MGKKEDKQTISLPDEVQVYSSFDRYTNVESDVIKNFSTLH